MRFENFSTSPTIRSFNPEYSIQNEFLGGCPSIPFPLSNLDGKVSFPEISMGSFRGFQQTGNCEMSHDRKQNPPEYVHLFLRVFLSG